MFSRSRILRRRAKLFRALSAYINADIAGENIVGIADALLSELPETVVRAAVCDSVRVLAGAPLTQKKAALLAWRLAGNIDKLNAGSAVLPWSGQPVNEVIPVCVEKVTPFKNGNKAGYVLHCRGQAGSLCGELFTQFFSSNSLRVVARVVGFSSNSWGPLQYGGVAKHFVNLLFFAHLDADMSRNGPSFHNVSVTPSVLKHNKNLLLVRCQAAPCPEGYQHACANCFKGYDTCVYGVRAQTCVEAHCRTCGQTAFFDPAADGIACINCSRGRNPAAAIQEEI